MSKLRTLALCSSLCLVILSLATFAYGQKPTTPPDSTLYTSYFSGAGYQNVNWIVCGSTQQSSGCFASGSLGPFGSAGALMEGNPSYNGSTVTRAIYVVDSASGSGGTGVTLYVYKKVDVVTTSSDTVTVTLLHTVPLALTGGAGVLTSMAGNNGFLFIGTNQSPQGVEVQKSNLNVTMIGGFSPPINVTGISADKYGYVTVTFGGFTSGEDGFYTFGPNGANEGDGGGAWFMLNTVTAVQTAALPPSAAQPNRQVEVHAKGN
jgi:hypothetical protein